MPEEVKDMPEQEIDPEWQTEVDRVIGQLKIDYPHFTMSTERFPMDNHEDMIDDQIIFNVLWTKTFSKMTNGEFQEWLSIYFGMHSAKVGITFCYVDADGDCCPCSGVEITAHYPNGHLLTMIKTNIEMFLNIRKQVQGK